MLSCHFSMQPKFVIFAIGRVEKIKKRKSKILLFPLSWLFEICFYYYY